MKDSTRENGLCPECDTPTRSSADLLDWLRSPYLAARYELAKFPREVLLNNATLAANLLALCRKLEAGGELSVGPVSKRVEEMMIQLKAAAAEVTAKAELQGVDALAEARARRLAAAQQAVPANGAPVNFNG